MVEGSGAESLELGAAHCTLQAPMEMGLCGWEGHAEDDWQSSTQRQQDTSGLPVYPRGILALHPQGHTPVNTALLLATCSVPKELVHSIDGTTSKT